MTLADHSFRKARPSRAMNADYRQSEPMKIADHSIRRFDERLKAREYLDAVSSELRFHRGNRGAGMATHCLRLVSCQ
jgi:hypothetical protein